MTHALGSPQPEVAVPHDDHRDEYRDEHHAVPSDTKPWWRTPPVDARGLLLWIATFVVMTAIITGIGLLLVHELGGVRSLDDRVARWLARHRTNTWDDVTFGGSFVADADIKIPLTVVLCGIFVYCWRRWTEAALLAGAL